MPNLKFNTPILPKDNIVLRDNVKQVVAEQASSHNKMLFAGIGLLAAILLFGKKSKKKKR